MDNIKQAIINAETALGIEFGSTRIKAVLIDKANEPLASGSYDWENDYDNGVWTYPVAKFWEGLQSAFAALKKNVAEKYGVKLETVGAMGISGMMHGYLPFDKDGNQLAAFRTWRNTITAKSAEELTALFDFNIPQRWSIAHLYQAILNGEEHVKDIDYIDEVDAEFTETETKKGVEVINVVWAENEHGNKLYHYDPDGAQLKENDIVLVGAKGEGDKEVARKATVAHGNHLVDPDTLTSPLKKIIMVIKQKVEEALVAETDVFDRDAKRKAKAEQKKAK